MSSNGRNRGYIGRNEITSPKGVIDGRQSYLNEEEKNWNPGTDWVRPSDWLQFPGYTAGEQIAMVLVAITDDELESNSVGVLVSGNYNVDWGDGTTGSFSAAATARKQYNFASISGATTSEGYKQVILKITPQSGANLTSVQFIPQGVTGAHSSMPSKWLEFNCNLPQCTTLRFAQISATNPWIKKIYINSLSSSCNALDRAGTFTNLESVYFPPNSTISNIQSAFTGAIKLKKAPILNGTPANRTFFQSGIDVAPSNLNWTNTTNCGDLFRESFIKYVPFIISMPNVITTSNGMFQNCRQLEYVEGINIPNATSPTSFFIGCSNLKYVGGITISNATSLNQFFSGCNSLENYGTIVGGTAITNASSMFNGCYFIKDAPPLDLRNCTNTSAMFSSCYSLENVPGYTFGNNATLAGMFSTCYSLKKLPEMNFSNIAVVDSGSGEAQRFTYFCFSLEKFPVKNLRVSMSLLNCRFGFTALSEVFAGLTGISGASATLTITGNPGASGITAGQIAGATAKGWTIVL